MICDYHIHSDLSGDGKSTMMEQIAACADKGILKICFTEHMDIGMLDGLFEADLPAYAKAMETARENPYGVKVFMGFELGYTGETSKELLKRSNSLPLDFKLLSRHIIDGKDPYDADYFDGKTRDFAAREYLEAVYRSVQNFPDYDAVAHIGYVFKFTGDKFSPLRHLDAPDVYDEILKTMVQNGKALELNTSRWDSEGMPGFDVFKRLRELGGELVTLGSDAHHAQNTGKGFQEALCRLKEIGFSYLASFEERRLVMEKI